MSVEFLLARYARAWADGRAEALAAHWDADAFRLYKAEEIATVFTRWAEVLHYWRANEALHAEVRLAFSNIVPIPLDPPWSLAWLQMEWTIRFADTAKAAMAGDNHVLALLTGEGDAMRFAGWCEAPDAPISYMRRLYESRAL